MMGYYIIESIFTTYLTQYSRLNVSYSVGMWLQLTKTYTIIVGKCEFYSNNIAVE